MITPTHTPALAEHYREPGGPWDQRSLDALLYEASVDASRRVLIVDGDHRITGSELNDRVAQFARWLSGNGVRAGDAITWKHANAAEVIVALRACWRIGAIAVPIHHGFSGPESSALIERIEPKLVVDLRKTHREVPERDEHPEALWADNDALAAALFTSGSSGTPKGVLHTHNTLAYKARTIAAVHGLTSDDVVLMPAPLAHVSGILNGVTVPGCTPFTTVLMQRWNPDHALDLIERERVTYMVGPPTFFISMMQSPAFSTERVASLRLISSGGAGVAPAFVEAASQAFGAVVKRTYGSTEAPSVATSAAGDGEASARDYDGRAVANAELHIGAQRELLVRGPEVCVGYLDAQHTQAAFDNDGWFHTGDTAELTVDGWLSITGRLSDVIIRGGENISANEIENQLMHHPEIESAVVVGYPDELMGERVCACITASGATAITIDALRQWCIQVGLAKFKIPERVLVLTELPLLASGKPNRQALKALAADSADSAD